MTPDLNGKRLDLLKESFPKVTRVAFLWAPGGLRGNLTLTDMEAAAKALGVKLQSLEVRSLDDFESAFARAKREGAQARVAGLITINEPVHWDNRIARVRDFDTVGINLDHHGCSRDAEILMNERVGNEFTDGNFGHKFDFLPQGIMDDFILRELCHDKTDKSLKANRVASRAS